MVPIAIAIPANDIRLASTLRMYIAMNAIRTAIGSVTATMILARKCNKNITSKKSFYRLVQVDNDGTTQTTDAIEVNYSGNLAGYELAQNYPNPFNPTTVIKYSIPEAANVEIKVYDMLGGEVADLVNEVKDAGAHEVNFNASSLSSGIYIYSIHAGEFVQTMKMTLLR